MPSLPLEVLQSLKQLTMRIGYLSLGWRLKVFKSKPALQTGAIVFERGREVKCIDKYY